MVLAHYLDRRPEWLSFNYGPAGKPELSDVHAHGLTFNLSHTDGLAVVVLSRYRRIGVDVEKSKATADLLETARHFFSESEYRQLTSLPSSAQAAAFFACWTRKEALLKGLGDGLTRELGQFSVSVLPGAPATLLECGWDDTLCQSWRLHPLEPGGGYAGALAYERTPRDASLTVETFEWSNFASRLGADPSL